MKQRVIACGVVLVIFAVATLGLYLILLNPMHHNGCPLKVVDAICTSTVLEHVSFWSTMLASTLGNLIILVSCVFFFVHAPLLPAHKRVRYRLYTASPYRPTLLQELFARGIHNRKDP